MIRPLMLLLLFVSLVLVSSCKSPSSSAETVEVQAVEESTENSQVKPVTNVVMTGEAFEVQIGEFRSAGTEFQLIDVRSPEEIQATGKIEGATILDWNAGEFQKEFSKLDEDVPVMLYCRSGGRSGYARNLLIENGFIEVYDLGGGMNGWLSEGRSVIKK